MNFKIIDLIKTVNSGSLSDVVDIVHFNLEETNGDHFASRGFTMNVGPANTDFIEYSDLTEGIVKAWVSSSFLASEAVTSMGDMYPYATGSWTGFKNSVKSELQSEISSSMVPAQTNGVPW